MDDTFGDALMVEMEDLFAQHEIFEQRRAACAGLQAVLIVGNADALIGRQVCLLAGVTMFAALMMHLLMGFPALAFCGVETGLVVHDHISL